MHSFFVTLHPHSFMYTHSTRAHKQTSICAQVKVCMRVGEKFRWSAVVSDCFWSAVVSDCLRAARPLVFWHPPSARWQKLYLMGMHKALFDGYAHFKRMHYAVAHCTTLQHTAPRCNTLHHAETHCTMLNHTAPRCTTVHHAALHCATLHHTTYKDSKGIHRSVHIERT